MWTYGVQLDCPHKSKVFVGTSSDFSVAYSLGWLIPERKDGWWAAQKCPECRRRRKVANAFVRLTHAE